MKLIREHSQTNLQLLESVTIKNTRSYSAPTNTHIALSSRNEIKTHSFPEFQFFNSTPYMAFLAYTVLQVSLPWWIVLKTGNQWEWATKWTEQQKWHTGVFHFESQDIWSPLLESGTAQCNVSYNISVTVHINDLLPVSTHLISREECLFSGVDQRLLLLI